MITKYTHASRIGTFTIERLANGLWIGTHEGERLTGTMHMPQQIVDDLAGGHGEWVGTVDTSTVGLSDDLGDWEPDFAQRG